MRGRWGLTATFAAALLAQIAPAAAQWAGSYGAQACTNVRGRLVCSNAYRSPGGAGSHAYDRWSDGSPAIGGGSSPNGYQFPQYLGGHNAWYGLGR